MPGRRAGRPRPAGLRPPSAADSPRAARSASVTEPWRLASRAPSGPSTSGTCAWEGARRGPGRRSRSAGAGWRRPGRRRAPPRRCPARRRRRPPRGCRRRCRRCAARRGRRPGPTGPSERGRGRRPSCPARRAGAARAAGPPPRARPAARAVSSRQVPGIGADRRRAAPTRPRGSRPACSSTGRCPRRSSAGRVALAALGLAHDLAVPVQPDARPGRRAGRPRARGATGPRSRSSTRTRNRAPALRANSHASSAVRRLPRCSGPEGEGA